MSGYMKATKRFEFSYGHLLPGHSGKCRNLHGHNAVVEVAVKGIIDENKGGSEGMVLDFGRLKDIVGEEILHRWDHKFLAAGDEWVVEAAKWFESQCPYAGSNDVPEFLVEPWMVSFQIVKVGCRTTAENLARLIFWTLRKPIDDLENEVELYSVRFYETPDSWAEYTAEDYLTDSFDEVAQAEVQYPLPSIPLDRFHKTPA